MYDYFLYILKGGKTMKGRKKLIIIAAIILIAVAVGAVRIIISGRSKVKEVEIGKVEAKDLFQVISVTGSIDSNNKEEIELPMQQKVMEVFAVEGQEVSSGDPILKIDSTDYNYQLKKYELALSLANSNFERLSDASRNNDKKTLENAVKQAEIGLDSSEANYNEAKRRYDRVNALYGSGAASKEEYETALKAMNDFQNQVELSTIQLGNAVNSLNDFDTNRNDQIKDQKNQIESSMADIANIKDKIEKSTIRSSISGKIVQLKVKPNQYPTMENNVVMIYDLSKYKVDVMVSQYDAVSVSPGQRASVKVKGIATDYKGTVTSISDAAVITMEGSNKEPKVKIEVTLDNPDDKIKAGYEADIDITLKESLNTAAVGFESVLEDEEGKRYAFAVVDGKAVKKYIKTGLETDFDIQVLEGLKAGDQYIKNPTSTLKDGEPVKQSGGKKSDNKS